VAEREGGKKARSFKRIRQIGERQRLKGSTINGTGETGSPHTGRGQEKKKRKKLWLVKKTRGKGNPKKSCCGDKNPKPPTLETYAQNGETRRGKK